MSRAIKAAENLISKYCIKTHKALNLKEIANAEKLIIEEARLNGLLGRIIFYNDIGFIQINKSINNEGLKRFTIAHEMGHALISKNSVWNKHGCTFDSLGKYHINLNHETVANQFAAELLMHKPWFSRFIKNMPVGTKLIRDIANEFNVSLTAAAIRYAEIGQYPTAVILSSGGVVKWSAINDYFPFKFLKAGTKVPECSNAIDYFKGLPMSEEYNMVKATDWFPEDFNARHSTYLYEECISLSYYDSVLTILWQSEFE